jgi:hypothetical protein
MPEMWHARGSDRAREGAGLGHEQGEAHAGLAVKHLTIRLRRPVAPLVVTPSPASPAEWDLVWAEIMRPATPKAAAPMFRCRCGGRSPNPAGHPRCHR